MRIFILSVLVTHLIPCGGLTLACDQVPTKPFREVKHIPLLTRWIREEGGVTAGILKVHDCWGVAWPLGWRHLCKTMDGVKANKGNGMKCEKQLGCYDTGSGLRAEIILGIEV